MSVLSPMIQKPFFLISAGSDPSLLPFPALLIVTHPNTPLYYSLLFGIFPLSINPKYAIIKSMVFNVAILTLELANSWTDRLPHSLSTFNNCEKAPQSCCPQAL